jgi:hypothetical protein
MARQQRGIAVVSAVLLVILHTLGAVVAAAALALSFAFFIFVGDANGRGGSLVSPGFDVFAAVVLFLAWFGLLWLFGYSLPLLMAICGAAVVLCLVYAGSYQATVAKEARPDAAQP